jgi:hypothetical protein
MAPLFVAIMKQDPVVQRPNTVLEEEREAWKTRMIEQMQQQLTVGILEREEKLHAGEEAPHAREMELGNIEAERRATRKYVATL